MCVPRIRLSNSQYDFSMQSWLYSFVSSPAAMIRWAAARDRERGQSARDDRDRQTASDTLTASGDVVGYVRCSDRDGTDDEGRAERDRSWKPPGRGAAGVNQRSSASTNPSTSPTSPAQ